MRKDVSIVKCGVPGRTQSLKPRARFCLLSLFANTWAPPAVALTVILLKGSFFWHRATRLIKPETFQPAESHSCVFKKNKTRMDSPLCFTLVFFSSCTFVSTILPHWFSIQLLAAHGVLLWLFKKSHLFFRAHLFVYLKMHWSYFAFLWFNAEFILYSSLFTLSLWSHAWLNRAECDVHPPVTHLTPFLVTILVEEALKTFSKRCSLNQSILRGRHSTPINTQSCRSVCHVCLSHAVT